MGAVEEEINKYPVCRCDCHFHPGVYRTDPCAVCGHTDSNGQIIGGKVYGFWIGHRFELTPEEISALLIRKIAGLFCLQKT